MAGGSSSGRSLEETPTWAVAVVCFILVLVSLIIEHILHLIGQWLKKKHKRALYEALEKVKSELMLLGFLSLLLTVLQSPISGVCIPQSVGATWHPCREKQEASTSETSDMVDDSDENRRRLLSFPDSIGGVRRILAAGTEGTDKCGEGKVSFVSSDGIHQLHIFIFVLAIFHVLYCITTLALGRLKMRKWKKWEKETKTIEYQFLNDPERFRFARDTSFGRRHLNFWTKHPILIWVVCFFRQFVRSVPKVDYLTLRHGFIMAHLAPQSQTKFDFQKYINRSLEEDFKVVVGISPAIWFIAVLFLLFNTHGTYSYLWLPFIPLIIILLVGTKLQVIITKMGLRIQEKGEVVKGFPVVEPADDLFWFNNPHLILYLIHFVLFQNAFQLAFFAWSVYEFTLKSCFHEHTEDIVIRISMGVIIQILCSYVTLPLYALVTQMGSTMKPTVFNERVATALRHWHHTARKHIKQKKGSMSGTPASSMPSTPTHGLSPVHLLRRYRSEVSDSVQTSPRQSNFDAASPDQWDVVDGSTSPNNQHNDGSFLHHHHHHHHHLHRQQQQYERDESHEPPTSTEPPPLPQSISNEHEIAMGHLEFSFDKRPRV
ncbi:MLO-like protein 6 [Macadamia integrifolia]|uniref:MLO-like protein 6 n=1 Tax=Macadamia integrifolia TaxID=60698 RepID=UPI001C4F049C|nr:MLO-like protein 6 [Macadamia integrifolia]